MYKEGAVFSKKAKEEMKVYSTALRDILERTTNAFVELFYFPEQELKLQEFFILTNRYFYIKPEQYRERQEVNKEYGIGYQWGKDILYITH